MWLTAGVVASLRGIGRGEECCCDTECESEGRRGEWAAWGQRSLRYRCGPDRLGSWIRKARLRWKDDEEGRRLPRKQSHPFCADNRLRRACLLSPSFSFPFIVKARNVNKVNRKGQPSWWHIITIIKKKCSLINMGNLFLSIPWLNCVAHPWGRTLRTERHGSGNWWNDRKEDMGIERKRERHLC